MDLPFIKMSFKCLFHTHIFSVPPHILCMYDVHVCISIGMLMYMRMGVHLCRGLRLISGYPHSLIHLTNEADSLSQSQSSLIWLTFLASSLWGSLSSEVWITGKIPHTPGIYVGSVDLDSGPQASRSRACPLSNVPAPFSFISCLAG